MELLTSGIEELSHRQIYPFAPLGVNFTIQLLWVVIRNFSKVRSDYRTAQEAKAEGGAGIFVGTQMVLYLFSFIITLIIFLSLDFLFKTREIASLKYMWWLPSTASIGLMEISKLLAKIFEGESESEVEEETELEGKTRQLSYFFWVSVIVMGGLWFVILFGKEVDLFYDFLRVFDRFFL